MTSDSKLFEKLKVYKNDANECITFKYIFDHSDLKESSSNDDEHTNLNTFKPEYTHQIFGDEESIFGYKNLKVNYFLTPGSLDAYIGLNYKEKITPKRFDGIESDDVYGAFEEFGCSPGYTKDMNVFSEKLAQDASQFRPFGTKIWDYSRPTINNYSYEIYKIDSSSSDHQSENFINYLLRVQTMLAFYIETFSFLDYEDTQWTHFLLYEKRKLDGTPDFRYVTIGYLSVYNYYAFPDKKRSRISQVLIFPSYQHMGHGAELVEAIYRDACLNENIADVTAEDPSPEFIKVIIFWLDKIIYVIFFK
jgi:histone acetyltransferase 1